MDKLMYTSTTGPGRCRGARAKNEEHFSICIHLLSPIFHF